MQLPVLHKHLENGVEGYTGSEHIIRTTKYRADGYIAERNLVIEFHGNLWHGYPEDHPKHHLMSSAVGRSNSNLFRETMDRMAVIKSLGYEVWYVWEHDFATIRNKPFSNIMSIVHKM